MSLIEATRPRAVDGRRSARRTALIVGALAVAVYVGFLVVVAVGGQ